MTSAMFGPNWAKTDGGVCKVITVTTDSSIMLILCYRKPSDRSDRSTQSVVCNQFIKKEPHVTYVLTHTHPYQCHMAQYVMVRGCYTKSSNAMHSKQHPPTVCVCVGGGGGGGGQILVRPSILER